MSHARQQIRDAAVADLDALTTTSTRCYAGKVYNLETLPALKVYTGKQSSQHHSTDGTGRINLHALEVMIEGHARGTEATLDNTLDTIAAEVETALEAGSMEALVKDVQLTDTEIAFEAGAAQPTGMIRLTYIVKFRTRQGAPETIVA